MKFDAEVISRCKFQVRATSIDGQQSLAFVIITIVDENDNAPVFTHEQFTGHVAEGVAVGSPVLDSKGKPLITKATDIDVTDNDKLTYEIVDINAKKMFAIHPATGAVTTNRVGIVLAYMSTVDWRNLNPNRTYIEKIRLNIDCLLGALEKTILCLLMFRTYIEKIRFINIDLFRGALVGDHIMFAYVLFVFSGH